MGKKRKAPSKKKKAQKKGIPTIPRYVRDISGKDWRKIYRGKFREYHLAIQDALGDEEKKNGLDEYFDLSNAASDLLGEMNDTMLDSDLKEEATAEMQLKAREALIKVVQLDNLIEEKIARVTVLQKELEEGNCYIPPKRAKIGGVFHNIVGECCLLITIPTIHRYNILIGLLDNYRYLIEMKSIMYGMNVNMLSLHKADRKKDEKEDGTGYA